MPNWAENILKISGDSDRIKELRAFIAGKNHNGEELAFDFEKVIPTPEELSLTTSPNSVNAQEMIDKYGYPDWCKFHTGRWGTKWNLSEIGQVIEGDGELEMWFETAWSPPEGIIIELAARFADLRFELWSCDPAMDWAFYLECDLGGMIVSEELPYDQSVKDRFGHNWDEDEDEE